MAAALPALVGTQAGMMGLGMMQASSAAKTERQQGKLQAEMEDVAAAQRETDRKMDLARSISSIRAGAAASGITGEGSPLTLIGEAAKAEERDTQRDVFMTKMRKSSALIRSRMRSGQIMGQATMSLLQQGSQMAQLGMGKPKDTGGVVK